MKSNSIIPVILVLCGYLTCAAGAYIIPVVIIDTAGRSPWFLYKVAWSQVLLLVSWSYILIFHLRLSAGSSRDETGMRISPARGFVVFTYAFISLLLVVISGFVQGNLLFERLHLALQVLLAVLFVVVLLLTALASSFDTTEGESHE